MWSTLQVRRSSSWRCYHHSCSFLPALSDIELLPKWTRLYKQVYWTDTCPKWSRSSHGQWNRRGSWRMWLRGCSEGFELLLARSYSSREQCCLGSMDTCKTSLLSPDRSGLCKVEIGSSIFKQCAGFEAILWIQMWRKCQIWLGLLVPWKAELAELKPAYSTYRCRYADIWQRCLSKHQVVSVHHTTMESQSSLLQLPILLYLE